MCDDYFVLIFYYYFILLTDISFCLKNGETALHIAVWKGFEQIVKILVEHGSNVDLQNAVFIFFFDFDFFHFSFSCCIIFILFCSFFNNFLFVKVWKDHSSHGCLERF